MTFTRVMELMKLAKLIGFQSEGIALVTLATVTIASISINVDAASAFSIGNSTSSTTFTDVPGQSFSSSVVGNAVVSTSPTSGSVFLTEFEIGFVNRVDSGGLFVFDQEYTGTPADLSKLTVGGSEGLLGRSFSVSDSIWDFGQGLLLSNVNATYFAYTNVFGEYRSDDSGSAYGGTELRAFYADPSNPLLQSFSGNTTSNEDIVFNAQFEPVPEPTSVLCVLALGALGAGSSLKRKRQQMDRNKDSNSNESSVE